MSNAIAKESTALGWHWSENKREWQLARIAEADRLLHTYVVGATGSGKTSSSKRSSARTSTPVKGWA